MIALQNAERHQEAQTERQRFATLSEAGRRLTAVTDEAQAYAVVAEIAQAHFRARVVLRRYRDATQLLETVYELGGWEAHPAQSISLHAGINGQVARTRETINIGDIAQLPSNIELPQLSRLQDRAILITPVVFDVQTYYGNLGLGHVTPHFFRNADISLIEGLAQQLAITLQRLETTAKEARLETEKRLHEAEMMTSIGQSITDLTHDLGNDLGLVPTLLNQIRRELTAQGFVSAAVSLKLDSIGQDVSRVLNRSKTLKHELSDMAQEKSRTSAIHLVSDLIEQAIQLSRIPKRIKIINPTGSFELTVMCDSNEVKAILRCLITNAVEIISGSGTITLDLKEYTDVVMIQVTDTGPGIDLALQARIFDLGYSTKKSSGFGLWSARRNALRNGGDLQVASVPGQGTKFTLWLPRR